MAYVGDVGTVFRCAIVDTTGAVVDLTGTDVTFRFGKPGGQLVVVDATILDAAGGIATYSGEAGLLSVAGPYQWQPVVNWPSGRTEEFKNVKTAHRYQITEGKGIEQIA